MAGHGFQLESGEQVVCEVQFLAGGALGLLLTLLGPLLREKKVEAAVVTDRRILKRVSGGEVYDLALPQVRMAYRNTSSDSLALEGDPRDLSILLPRVANIDEVLTALGSGGVTIEDEISSPIRRYLR